MNVLRFAVPLLLLASLPTQAVADDGRLTRLELSRACLDTIWQTVNTVHYDSTFGGADWRAIRARYRARLDSLGDDHGFVPLMNQMLQELGLSHYGVFQAEEKAATGSELLSGGCLGLEIRLFAGEAVVSSVMPGYPAARAGLRPGCVIVGINGVPVDTLLEQTAADQPPYLNERARLSAMISEIGDRFFGRVGTAVKLDYRDGRDTPREVTLRMKGRTGKIILAKNYPPMYVGFTARRLPDDIGYVSFSTFLPPVDKRFAAALRSMTGLRGLIVDIRGNPGGMHEIGEALAAKLLPRDTTFSVFRYRDRTDKVVVHPSPPVFTGRVAILIDVMNASASERFAACMQSVGRAVVIGERSPGLVGPSAIKRLPNGASLMYLIAQSLTPDGTVLEGHGVIPNIEVGLDRRSLLDGVDPQLQRAIACVKGGTD